MPKTICQIDSDPKLNIIKAFRIANKRAGEAKREGPARLENYLQYCAVLRDLKSQAEAQGFKIWIMNGKTGHTYEKDYKVTPDEQNDYEAYQTELQAVRTAAAIETTEPEVNNVINPDLASDEDVE